MGTFHFPIQQLTMPSVWSLITLATLASHAVARRIRVEPNEDVVVEPTPAKETCIGEKGFITAIEVNAVETRIIRTADIPGVFGSFTAVYSDDNDSIIGVSVGEEMPVEVEIELDVTAITTWLDDVKKDSSAKNPLSGITLDDDCNTDEFSWQIHEKWTHAAGNDWAYGTDCGPDKTGAHYDPTSKCGPASGCTDEEKASAEYTSTCGYVTEELEGGCELGDLSGRHGELETVTEGASTTIPHVAFLDPFFPAFAGLGPTIEGTAETEDSKTRSLVLHLTCSSAPRVFCARLFQTDAVKHGDGSYVIAGALSYTDHHTRDVNVVQTIMLPPATDTGGTPAPVIDVTGSFAAAYADDDGSTTTGFLPADLVIELDVTAISTWLGELQKYSGAENPLAGITVNDDCNTDKFSWHIHEKWPTEGKDWAYGIDCGPKNTGPHYDPTSKCGPASGCTDKEKAGANYTCNTTSQEGCELGDLSGRHGHLKTVTKGASTTIPRVTLSDPFFPFFAGFESIEGEDSDFAQARSLVLHLTCAGAPRVFCAKLFQETDKKNTKGDFLTLEEEDEVDEFDETDVADDMKKAARHFEALEEDGEDGEEDEDDAGFGKN